jgi:hypothetical protein
VATLDLRLNLTGRPRTRPRRPGTNVTKRASPCECGDALAIAYPRPTRQLAFPHTAFLSELGGNSAAVFSSAQRQATRRGKRDQGHCLRSLHRQQQVNGYNADGRACIGVLLEKTDLIVCRYLRSTGGQYSMGAFGCQTTKKWRVARKKDELRLQEGR